jgi:RsiW-degrading membrane proteinase PrsW (M82 family)
MRRDQMEAMPRHDPLPPRRRPDYERAAAAWKRYWAIMRWMALLAIVTVLLSLIYLKRSGAPVPLHMLIATIAGVGLTVLVGTGLMGLLFVSNRSGMDDEAGGEAPSGDSDDD